MREPGRITANAVDFAYLEEGDRDAPLALCLHGFPDHAPTFEALLRDLAAAGLHAVAPWMRGYAPTAVPADGRYQTGALAADALALADALHPGGPAVVVGHDWGASAAYTAAAFRPGRFSKVVGMAVPPSPALAAKLLFNPQQLKRSWYVFFFQSPLAETAVQASDFALIDVLWRDWSAGYAPDPRLMRALKDTLSASGSLEAAIGYYRALFDPSRQDPALRDIQDAAGRPVDAPTLYLHGADDGCLGAELVDAGELKAFFPGGLEVEIVPGTGHFLHLERPDVVNRRIVEFLSA